MIRSILISTAGAIAMSLACWLFARARPTETDQSGQPILRYLAAPYMMFLLAAVWLCIGIYQWFDPFNHRYSGNMLMLSYAPIVIGILSIGMGMYLLNYRATLRSDVIEVTRWPLGTAQYKLSDARSIETGEQSTVLRFSDNRKFVVYNLYSGRVNFLSVLRAKNSFKPTSLRDAT